MNVRSSDRVTASTVACLELHSLPRQLVAPAGVISGEAEEYGLHDVKTGGHVPEMAFWGAISVLHGELSVGHASMPTEPDLNVPLIFIVENRVPVPLGQPAQLVFDTRDVRTDKGSPITTLPMKSSRRLGSRSVHDTGLWIEAHEPMLTSQRSHYRTDLLGPRPRDRHDHMSRRHVHRHCPWTRIDVLVGHRVDLRIRRRQRLIEGGDALARNDAREVLAAQAQVLLLRDVGSQRRSCLEPHRQVETHHVPHTVASLADDRILDPPCLAHPRRSGHMAPAQSRRPAADDLDQLQRTSEYKIGPLKKAARELLGYPHPRRVPRGLYVEQAIGISTDEFTRAKDSGVRYLRNVFPLIDLGWDRARCTEYLAERGFEKTVKSACLGCPFHGNTGWKWIHDHDPDGWADAVAFDKAIRDGYPRATEQGQPLRGQYFLHRSCQPLDEVDLDPPARAKRHLRLVTATAAAEEDDPDGCSPWSCRSGTAVAGNDTEERAA